jgi:broad specificity phosphatase PhoE
VGAPLERLILLRHGESVFTADEVLNGDPSVEGPLTDLGRAQARKAAEDLRHEPIDLAISSAFPRTRETAAIVVSGRDIPIEVMPGLNDPPVGEFEGAPFDEYFRWIYERDWHDLKDGCESQLQSVTRYVEAFSQIAGREAKTVLVVAHAFVTSLALTLVDPDESPIRLQYEKEVELATPYFVSGDDLRAGLERARKELARIGDPA